MFELIYPATSFLSTALLFWSAFRAWRATNPVLKWGGPGVAVDADRARHDRAGGVPGQLPPLGPDLAHLSGA